MENRFCLTCPRCRWKHMTTGISTDLEKLNLREMKGCANCGGRKFRCPKCGAIAKMLRVKGGA